MYMVGFEDKRKRFFNDLMATIRKNPGAPMHPLIARFSIATGLSMEKAREYLKALEQAGFITIKEYRVYPVKEAK